MSAAAALSIRGMRVEYPLEDGRILAAVDGLDLEIAQGEIHALVGESGAGKTTVGNALMGLLDAPGRVAAGTVAIAGHNVDFRTGRAAGIVQGRDVGAIFQDPMTSLNPLFTVESQIGETLRFHLGLDRTAARARTLELLRAVGIPEPERRLKAYPHQLSGGQRQRIVIAAALSCDPKLLVADEPTTALDVSVQAQILDLVRALVRERGLGVLLVTHNMGVVAEIADRVTVMRGGKVVESGKVADVLTRPQHAYVQGLVAAVPRIDKRLARFATIGDETAGAQAARSDLRTRYMRPRAEKLPDAILEVANLTVEYGSGGLLGLSRKGGFRAVDDVSFAVKRGEIFGIVGESGSGKTTVANAVAGLVRAAAGTIRFADQAIGDKRPRALRGAMQMVFQDPYASLNSRMRIDDALAEPMLFHGVAQGRSDADARIAMLIEAVGLASDAKHRYPFAFSGGQRQRLSIARALAAEPQLVVCDEPTSSLDVSVQAQILNLLKDLRDATGLTLLFISHDLAVVRQMCDRVAVMQGGRIVEMADCETLFSNPQHTYTKRLLSLVPNVARIGNRLEPTGAAL
ncbi:MAG: ABC transporter ATP-binding protein [Magnetospirillum sp.]|nr:ABC transporter ATP-binding protein [Magnetospirillum sp.]